MQFVLYVLLTLLVGCGARSGSPPTPRPVPTFPTARVTADQVARAMEQDAFFATYGQNSLLIQGTVRSIASRGGERLVVLDTTMPTKVECDLGSQPTSARVGDAITIRSADPGQDASRDAGMVLLRNCVVFDGGS